MVAHSQSLLTRIRQHAEVRGIGDPSVPAMEWLARAKKFLKLERLILLRNHRQGMSGMEVAQWRSAVIDVLLEFLLRNALRGLPEREVASVAVLALGGYGRGELCPFSDIDVMLLYDAALTPAELAELQERVTTAVLYPLWDLKLKVGHASRTVLESIEAARADGVTCNALLEARLISGSEKLFAQLMNATSEAIREDGVVRQVAFLLDEQARRHTRNGGTIFVQEPDIKNGVGGLRDFHTLCWLAHLFGTTDGTAGLVKSGFLKRAEAKAVAEAYSFLLRVRHELHFQSERATDVLSLEKQPAVAGALSCPGENWMRQIEALMRDYYRAADTIRQTARMVEWRFERPTTPHPRRRSDEAVVFDGVVMQGGILSAANSTVFNQDPARLLRVFRHAQQYRVQLDFPLLRLVREKIALLTPRVATSSQAVDCFLSILADAGRVGETLAQMHEAGVLCRFLPEFSGIHCLVQREIYHRYTVDVHTLLCLKELDAVFAGTTPVAARYRSVLFDTEEPALLYLVLLLHDIGKQFGVADHAETGAVLAEKILKRFRVRPAVRQEVLALIRGHLEMSAFWQKHDLEDSANLDAFAAQVSSAQRLRYLYVLTYCDARATAPELWNDYKNTLHSQLFAGTLARFERSEPEQSDNKQGVKDMLHRKIIEEDLAGEITDEELEAHFNLVPERYFQQYEAADICLHIRMVNQLLFTITSAHGAGALAPVINWTKDKAQGVSVVTIVTWDREGLFYQVAGAFAVAGLNILSGKAIARTDHIAIDTFRVAELGRGTGDMAALQETFSHHLEEALVQQGDLEPAIRKQAALLAAQRSAKERHLSHGPAKTKVSIYREINLHRTIVEIETKDRIGLLFFLGRIFFRHRLDITFARITTERGAAVDTFYLEPFSGEADKTPEELKALREAILAALK